MKTPILIFVSGLALLLLVQAVSPQNGAGLGYVMGHNFMALLANPNVSLKVEQVDDTVYFAWTSPSPARLEETLAMGLHMQMVKRELEVRSAPLEFDEHERTAESTLPQGTAETRH